MGYRGMGHIGNRAHGHWGQWVQEVSGTGGMGHMANGAHGQWGPWAMRPTGAQGVWAYHQ